MDMKTVRAQRSLGEQNRSAVLEEVVLRGPLSRAKIAETIGLSGAAVSRIVRPLLDDGILRELEDIDRARFANRLGRPPVLLDIAPEGGQVLGIDLSLSFQGVRLADLKNRTISKIDLDIDTRDTPDTIIDRLGDASLRLIDENLEDRTRLLGGFVMVAGAVDSRHEIVTRAYYLGWQDIPLGPRLSRILALPIRVESLMTSVALAEARFGAAKGRDDVLVAICGIRLVTGLMLNGQIIEGRRFPAGIVGRIPMVGEDGHATLVDRGASGLGVLLRMYGDSSDILTMPFRNQVALLTSVIARDRKGDPAVGQSLAATGRTLGRLLVQFALLVAPESLVIAGPLSAAPSFVEAAKEAVASAMGEDWPVEVSTSAVLGPDNNRSASCNLAICEYLFERPIDPTILGVSRPLAPPPPPGG